MNSVAENIMLEDVDMIDVDCIDQDVGKTPRSRRSNAYVMFVVL